VQDKLRLDLSDEDAERFFLKLLNDSVTAMFAGAVDWLHNIAMAVKK
jgi:hypothetical protein